jgi:OFA family oxalate/formate antiporter-like MFS transporter
MQRWLPNRKGLASGLSLSAFGFSVVFFTPVAEFLLSRFGVAATFRIFALIFFIVMMPASLFIKYPAEVSSGSGGQDQENQRHASLMEAVFSLRFAEIAIATFTVTGAWNIVFPLIKIMAESDFRNVPPVMATATVMLTGICSSAGRLVAPAVSDRLGRPISIIILACLTICGCVTLIYAKGILFCVAVGLIAFAFGGPSGIFPAMVMEDFGSTNFGSIYGVEMFSLGLSSVFFSRVTHFLSGDGDYTKALLLGAGVCAITIIDMAHYWKKQGEGGGKSQCVAEAS